MFYDGKRAGLSHSINRLTFSTILFDEKTLKKFIDEKSLDEKSLDEKSLDLSRRLEEVTISAI